MKRIATTAVVIAILFVMSCSIAEAQDVHRLAMGARSLSLDDVAELESTIEQSPEDTTARTKLLGYYFSAQYKRPDAIKPLRKHVLWFIEHKPDSKVLDTPYGQLDAIKDAEGYALAKGAWLGQIEKNPDSVAMLGNAAKFFTQHDRDLAIDSLKKAHALDLKNPDWLEQLGHVHSLGMHTNSLAAKKRAAKTALEYYEKALSLSDPRASHTLSYTAKTALVAEETAKARGYAKQMLKLGDSSWNAGNNIHHGNLVLGQLALNGGEIEEAKAFLLAAGKTPGSPQLNSFGPNMTLALDLLAEGERDVVLEYFDLCSKFWQRGELDTWTKDVKAGRTPNFGANLRY